jgi:hypothetical protein
VSAQRPKSGDTERAKRDGTCDQSRDARSSRVSRAFTDEMNSEDGAAQEP